MVGLGVGKNNKLIIGVEKNIFPYICGNIFLGYRSKQKKASCIKHDAFYLNSREDVYGSSTNINLFVGKTFADKVGNSPPLR